jgi:phosphate ABC transporter phosphate-binding protein
MFTTTCPACGCGLEVDDARRGEAIKCPRCGQPVAVASAELHGKGETHFFGTPPPRSATPSPTDARDLSETLLPGMAPAPSKRNPGDFNFLAPADDGVSLGWLAHYRVVKLLGKGGMGMVFLADDTHLDRRVALKVVRQEMANDAELRQRFIREAKTTASVKSDHIITIHQVSQHNDLPFLAMEYLEGESLDDALRRDPHPDLALVLRIGREVALGLAAAHERGLVHRDIKPANIFLEAPNRRVKILDFGLARPARVPSDLTQPGMIIGTPDYMSPEQADGDAVSERSDLFSLGCVLYRMLSGEKPFDGNTTLAVLKAVALKDPKPLREANPAVPPALAELVKRLMAKEPKERPASAREVAEALDAIARRPTELPALLAAAPRRRRVPPVAWVAVAGLVLVIGFLGVYFLSHHLGASTGSSGQASIDPATTPRSTSPTSVARSGTTPAVRPAAAHTLTCGGSSLVAPLLDKWASVYRDEKNVRVIYSPSPSGSGAGIQQLLSQALDFACTEAPLTDEQTRQAGGEVMYIPISLGGVVPAYHLDGIAKPLRFSGPVLARIYLGEITRWNDPAVREINPGVDLPDQEITVLHRADSSGSSYVFTDFLSKVSKEWQQRIGTSTTPKWPVGVGQRRNEGMVEALQKRPGAIAYVDLLDALQARLQYGSVKNRNGNYMLATLESVVSTTESAVPDMPVDLRFSLTYAPGKDAYPICGCTWAILYAKQPDGKGQRLVEFLRWVTQEGQEYNTDLFYARLPGKLSEKVQARLNEVRFGD